VTGTPAPWQILTYCPFGDTSICDALGVADYSYYFVLKRFRPVLEQFGAVQRLTDLALLDRACEQARAAGRRPVLFHFAPPHTVPPDPPCPVIPVFAWEFDTIPDEHWDDDVRHNWAAVLGGTPAAITHSESAVAAVRRSLGSDYPVVSAPAPVWDGFHRIAATPWDEQPRRIELDGTVLDSWEIGLTQGPPFPEPQYPHGLTAVELSGVVFTSIFNPQDGRKNWYDLLTAFVWAFRDNPEATLVLKLVHFDRVQACWAVLQEMRKLAPYRCRVVVIHGYLDDGSFAELVLATTYTVNASHAEGQCLPLMEFMSAGRPAIAPGHTAMADYITPANAFVVAGTPEWAAWPQDPRMVFRCMRYRINWESVRDAYVAAWDTATSDRARYLQMAQQASADLERHCSAANTVARVGALLSGVSDATGTAVASSRS
jgi:glycosyltransferase involved in cell wall biosynthesis